MLPLCATVIFLYLLIKNFIQISSAVCHTIYNLFANFKPVCLINVMSTPIDIIFIKMNSIYSKQTQNKIKLNNSTNKQYSLQIHNPYSTRLSEYILGGDTFLKTADFATFT